jgi:hypothetical protein
MTEPSTECQLTEPGEIAEALCRKAKERSREFADLHVNKSTISYPFALGYMTGTMGQLLQYLTPEQRQQIVRTLL